MTHHMADRYLYLVRHGEALPDESGLTENGRRQAVLLGQRLRTSSGRDRFPAELRL